MKSFGGGLQIFLPRFFPEGQTLLRGGTWKGDPNACTSGTRMLSGGYGKYENWGFRTAVSPTGNNPPNELTLNKGENILRFWRDQPPQYGLAVKEFTLTPEK